jgi:hypothetical protein
MENFAFIFLLFADDMENLYYYLWPSRNIDIFVEGLDKTTKTFSRTSKCPSQYLTSTYRIHNQNTALLHFWDSAVRKSRKYGLATPYLDSWLGQECFMLPIVRPDVGLTPPSPST